MHPVPPAHYDPHDVPMLRRQLIEWTHTKDAFTYWANAIAMGKQSIMPNLPQLEAAASLVLDERRRLTDAGLYFIAEDLCDLINQAGDTMPPFVPQPSSLPSPAGFVLFARPFCMRESDVDLAEMRRISSMIDQAAIEAGLIDTPGRPITLDTPGVRETLTEPVEIVAASWGPMSPINRRTREPEWPAGGIWMSFYSHPRINHREVWREAAPLLVDNEMAFAFWPGDPHPRAKYALPPGGDDTTLVWGRLVLSAFQVALQANLTETEQIPTPRAERRRTERLKLPKPIPTREIQIVRLRPRPKRHESPAPGRTGTGGSHSVRYPVRPFWREQWVPSLGDHRPRLIASHWRGPEDAPIQGAERVYYAALPPKSQRNTTS